MLKRVILNLVVMAVVTGVLYRILATQIPVLPWERPKPTPTPVAAATPLGRQPIRIGISDRPANLPMAALPKWPDNHQAVEVVVVPDTNLRWEMLAAGQLDMACGTLDSFSLALMRFPRVGIYLFSLGTSVGEDVLVASSATRLTDLKHKSVAVPQGQDYVVGLALSQAGLSPSETTMIATHTDQEALAELHQHAVQAALLWEPQLAKGGEGTSVVFTTADAKTPRIEEMCAVRPDVLHSRPAEVSSVMRTWFHIIDTLRTKPGLAREPIARATGLAVDVLGDYLKTVQLSTLAENRNALDQALLVSTIQDQQSDFKMMGKTGTASAEVSQAVNLDLLRQLPATVEEQQQQQQ